METISPHDILTILRRRLWLMLAVSGVLLILAVAFTLQWSRYRAVTTIAITQPDVPAGVLAGEQAVLADRRIGQIQQRVLSTESLSAIIAQVGLYPDASPRMAATKLADQMRRAIRLEFITSPVSNPAAVQKESVEQLSAIGFILRFDYPDAALAQQAVTALADRFIAEEEADRLSQSERTVTFLESQLAELGASIADQEKRIADFKAEHGESGQAALMFNQQAQSSARMSLQSIDSQLAGLEATERTLSSQLLATEPYLAAPGAQNTPGSLSALQSQLAMLSTRYGPAHPDVVKVQSQIAALQTHVTARSPVTDASNPAYQQLSSQLESTRAQRRALQAQRGQVMADQKGYAQRIATNPHAEQQMAQLTRDLDNAQALYRELSDKKMAASMRQSLERAETAARLSVLRPAELPEGTTPSRRLLMMAGLFLSLIGGLGAAIVAEMLSQTIRGAGHLAALVGAAPLVQIPHIEASEAR